MSNTFEHIIFLNKLLKTSRHSSDPNCIRGLAAFILLLFYFFLLFFIYKVMTTVKFFTLIKQQGKNTNLCDTKPQDSRLLITSQLTALKRHIVQIKRF